MLTTSRYFFPVSFPFLENKLLFTSFSRSRGLVSESPDFPHLLKEDPEITAIPFNVAFKTIQNKDVWEASA